MLIPLLGDYFAPTELVVDVANRAINIRLLTELKQLTS